MVELYTISFVIWILFNEGYDFEGVIKIHFPSLKMECYDEYGVLLNWVFTPKLTEND